MAKVSEMDMNSWFERQGLTWSEKRYKVLYSADVGCVEEMKLLHTDILIDHFTEDPFIVQAKAKLACKELLKKGFDFSKCPVSAKSVERNGGLYTGNMSCKIIEEDGFSYTVTVTKTKAEKYREHLAKERKNQCTALAVLNKSGMILEGGDDSDGYSSGEDLFEWCFFQAQGCNSSPSGVDARRWIDDHGILLF